MLRQGAERSEVGAGGIIGSLIGVKDSDFVGRPEAETP